jgi:hypothetical protein
MSQSTHKEHGEKKAGKRVSFGQKRESRIIGSGEEDNTHLSPVPQRET